ncbi:hypothetical protein AB8E26_09415 [Stenotrophomonas rhizophila]|uniref:hypothetical protein n=1 Tax=Stenotrophomonas rhizophila TaxID=216778 RepID=UPI0035191FEA
MPCTIPVSLLDRGMLLQELTPAAVLFACAVGLAFYRGLEPRKKIFSVAIICIIGLMTSTSTAMLAFRSKVVVQDDTVTFYAGRWKAQLPVAALGDAGATNQIFASLRKRTNGFSSGKVSAGWFQDPTGRKIFALSSGNGRIISRTSGEFSLVLDQATYDELKSCIADSTNR